MLFSRLGGTGTSAVTTKGAYPAAAPRSTNGAMLSGGAAGDIAVKEFRNPAPRRLFEIVEREIAFQGARHRADGAGHGRWRGGQRCGFVEHGGRSVFLGC